MMMKSMRSMSVFLACGTRLSYSVNLDVKRAPVALEAAAFLEQGGRTTAKKADSPDREKFLKECKEVGQNDAHCKTIADKPGATEKYFEKVDKLNKLEKPDEVKKVVKMKMLSDPKELEELGVTLDQSEEHANSGCCGS